MEVGGMQWLLLAEVAEDREEEQEGKRHQEAILDQGEILAEEEEMVEVGEGGHLGVIPEVEIILREIYHLINEGEMHPEIEEEEEGEVRDPLAADKELLRLEDEVELRVEEEVEVERDWKQEHGRN